MNEINECVDCKYYNKDEEICGAFECYGFECPELPCELNSNDEQQRSEKK